MVATCAAILAEFTRVEWDNARMKNLWLILVLLASTIELFARGKHLPLPPQVAAAKTGHIDNQSGLAKIGDRAYERLTKWGTLSGHTRPKEG